MKRGLSTIARKGLGFAERSGAGLLVDESVLQGKTFWQNMLVRLLSGISLVLNGFSWCILFFFFSSTRDRVVLHYNVYLGVDIVGVPHQVFWVPAVGLLFWLVNTSLAYFLYRHLERIAAYLLLLVNFMLGIGVIIASISLSLVNY